MGKTSENIRGRNYGISFIRTFAVLCIIASHCFKRMGSNVSFFLTIGVPIFLFISGWIFGSRPINGALRFYKKRLIRILPAYYIMLVFIIIGNLLMGISVTFKQILVNVLCIQNFVDGIPECGHLWYITAILICYIITPVLAAIRDRLKCKRFIRILLYAFICCLLAIAGYLLGELQFFAFICSYVFGFVASAEEISRIKSYGILVNVFTVLSVLAWLGLLVYNITVVQVPSFILLPVNIFTAVMLCLFFSGIAMPRMGILDVFDRYSYEEYLSHNVFILGALSTFGLTGFLPLDIFLALIATAGMTLVLNFLSEPVIRLLSRNERKNQD